MQMISIIVRLGDSLFQELLLSSNELSYLAKNAACIHVDLLEM